MALIVASDGVTLSPAYRTSRVPVAKVQKWQLPDTFVFVDELPHTSTRKAPESRIAAAISGLEMGGLVNGKL